MTDSLSFALCADKGGKLGCISKLTLLNPCFKFGCLCRVLRISSYKARPGLLPLRRALSALNERTSERTNERTAYQQLLQSAQSLSRFAPSHAPAQNSAALHNLLVIPIYPNIVQVSLLCKNLVDIKLNQIKIKIIYVHRSFVTFRYHIIDRHHPPPPRGNAPGVLLRRRKPNHPFPLITFWQRSPPVSAS